MIEPMNKGEKVARANRTDQKHETFDRTICNRETSLLNTAKLMQNGLTG